MNRTARPQTDATHARATNEPAANGAGSFIRSGAVAGAISAFAFAIIHHIFISDIWFSLIMMMAAGALCGLCIAWSYGLLVDAPSISNWAHYNTLYIALLGLLGAVSVLFYEPVTTTAELLRANGSPEQLIGQALPLTVLITLVAAAGIGLLYGSGWFHFGAILLTSSVLVLFLGLNISVIGLVSIPRGSLYLIVELFGLILVLNLVFAAAFAALEGKSLLRSAHPLMSRQSGPGGPTQNKGTSGPETKRCGESKRFS